MNRDEKLAKLILLEAESLKQCTSVTEGLVLAEEITKDAVELAKIVELKTKENKMSKVIDIMTGEALDVLPFNKEQAEELLSYLLNYKVDESQVNFGERYMLNSVMRIIENNSGASVMEILERKKA